MGQSIHFIPQYHAGCGLSVQKNKINFGAWETVVYSLQTLACIEFQGTTSKTPTSKGFSLPK